MTTTAISAVLKIVTVEDSAIIVDRIVDMLSDIPGVEFLGNARSVLTAIALIAECKPHMAMLDINLGGADGRSGIELLMVIRKLYPEMKIMMLTNLAVDLLISL
jgi:two-component system chemotaxis response regulator CheB